MECQEMGLVAHEVSRRPEPVWLEPEGQYTVPKLSVPFLDRLDYIDKES